MGSELVFFVVDILLVLVVVILSRRFKANVEACNLMLRKREQDLLIQEALFEDSKTSLQKSSDIITDSQLTHIERMIIHSENVRDQYKLLYTEAEINGDDEKADRCIQNISILQYQIVALDRSYFDISGKYFRMETEWIYKTKVN
jgi:hypothetical protein